MDTREIPVKGVTRSFLRVTTDTRSISGPSAPKSSKYEYLLSRVFVEVLDSKANLTFYVFSSKT